MVLGKESAHIFNYRYGYETLNRTRDVWQRTRKAGIPFVSAAMGLFDPKYSDICNLFILSIVLYVLLCWNVFVILVLP